MRMSKCDKRGQRFSCSKKKIKNTTFTTLLHSSKQLLETWPKNPNTTSPGQGISATSEQFFYPLSFYKPGVQVIYYYQVSKASHNKPTEGEFMDNIYTAGNGERERGK